MKWNEWKKQLVTPSNPNVEKELKKAINSIDKMKKKNKIEDVLNFFNAMNVQWLRILYLERQFRTVTLEGITIMTYNLYKKPKIFKKLHETALEFFKDTLQCPGCHEYPRWSDDNNAILCNFCGYRIARAPDLSPVEGVEDV